MTVAADTNKVSYSPASPTTSFAFAFPIFAESNLVVLREDAAGVQSTLTNPADYTVSAATNPGEPVPWPNGGTITTTSSYSDGKIVVKRVLTVTQPTDLPEGGALPVTSIEQMADRVVMLQQQLEEVLGRAIVLAETDSASPVVPGVLALNPNTFLAVNGSGTLVLTSGASAGGIVVSPYIETLIDDADAEEARGTLRADVAVESGSGSTTLTAAHRGRLIRRTGAGTVNLTAAATLGTDWFVTIFADGGAITVDPNGAETINGVATLTIEDGRAAVIYCDGTSAFYAYEVKQDPVGVGFPAPDYETTGESVTDSTVLQVPHGLGAVPAMAQAVLVCTSAEHGFSIGDEIFAIETNGSASAVNRGISVAADATNIYVIQADDGMNVIRPSDQARATITPANWTWTVRAWA